MRDVNMRDLSRSGARYLLMGLILVLVAACGGSPTEAPPSDPRAMLDAAAKTIQQVKTVRFKLQLTGAPAYIDTDKVISFVAADGSYIAPDRVGAKVSAAVLGVPGQIELVAVGSKQFYKHVVLTGNRWLEKQFSPGFNADKLIRSDQGIRRAIETLKGIKMVGREDLFGTPVYHISAQSSIVDISAVTVGLIRGTADVQVDVYLDVSGANVERMVLVQPETVSAEHPDPTTWTMELFNYDDPSITIEVPQAETPVPTNPTGNLPAIATPVPTAEATQQP
jgi:hypothetical protein